MPDGRTILLVEDDDSLRRILARHLRSRGHEVAEAASEEDAERALSSGAPALVILDINLPGETGWALLRSDAYSAAGSPPVVVASALSVRPRLLAELGVAGYLPKPFPLETLVDCVERFAPRGGAERDA